MKRPHQPRRIREPAHGTDPERIHFEGSSVCDFQTLCGACQPGWLPQPAGDAPVDCAGCLDTYKLVTGHLPPRRAASKGA